MVITDENGFAETSPTLGKADVSYVSLSNFASAEKASFTTSGKALNYQLNGATDDPVIVRVITAAVPEPGTWAMLIAGFGLIVAQLRRHARLAAQQALKAQFFSDIARTANFYCLKTG